MPLFVPRPAAAEKYALIVGVDDYAPAGTPPPFGAMPNLDLDSCETDALLMYDVLVSRYGFAEDNVRLLLSLREGMEATGANILGAFHDHLVGQAEPGDVVVFYFSGHGTRIADDEGGDERDKRDEALVPADALLTRKLLTDDQLDFLLAKLRTTHVTVIVDSCHAGTVTRAPGRAGESAKSIPYDPRFAELPEVKAVFPDYQPPSEPRKAKSGLALDEIGPEVLLAACQPWESSSAWGMVLDVRGQRQRGSLMTSHLCQVLRSARAGATWEEILRALRPRLASACAYDQNPTVEGPHQRAVFSAGEPAGPPRGPQLIARPADHIRVFVDAQAAGRVALPKLPFTRAAGDALAADVVISRPTQDELGLEGPASGGFLAVPASRPLDQQLVALFQFRRTGMLANRLPRFTASLRPAQGQKLSIGLSQELALEFQSTADAYVTLFTLAPDGTVRPALADEAARANRLYRLPSEDLPARVTFESPSPQPWGGTGLAKLIATLEPLGLDPDASTDEPGKTFLDQLLTALNGLAADADRPDMLRCDGWTDAAAYFHVGVGQP